MQEHVDASYAAASARDPRVPPGEQGRRLQNARSRRATAAHPGVPGHRDPPSGAGLRETFTVRKVSFGVGVEADLPRPQPGVDQHPGRHHAATYAARSLACTCVFPRGKAPRKIKKRRDTSVRTLTGNSRSTARVWLTGPSCRDQLSPRAPRRSAHTHGAVRARPEPSAPPLMFIPGAPVAVWRSYGAAAPPDVLLLGPGGRGGHLRLRPRYVVAPFSSGVDEQTLQVGDRIRLTGSPHPVAQPMLSAGTLSCSTDPDVAVWGKGTGDYVKRVIGLPGRRAPCP